MSERKRAMRSDFKKVDAHEITPEEYDEIPELTDDWFAQAELHVGGKPVRRGRPKSDRAKQAVTIRLDPEVVASFRATGRGWQTRINAVLVKAARRLRARSSPARGAAARKRA